MPLDVLQGWCLSGCGQDTQMCERLPESVFSCLSVMSNYKLTISVKGGFILLMASNVCCQCTD